MQFNETIDYSADQPPVRSSITFVRFVRSSISVDRLGKSRRFEKPAAVDSSQSRRTRRRCRLTIFRNGSIIQTSLVARFEFGRQVALRIGDASFSIASLCALLRLHSEAVGADATLTAALWSQLATRAAEIDHTTLGAVYRTLRYAGPAQAALRRLCERRLQVRPGSIPITGVTGVCNDTDTGFRLPTPIPIRGIVDMTILKKDNYYAFATATGCIFRSDGTR